MSAHAPDPFEAYVRTVECHLAGLPAAYQEQILVELRSHLHDALQDTGGASDAPARRAAVLAALGPADRLGRSLARMHRSAPYLRRVAGLGLLGSLALILLTVVADIVIDQATNRSGSLLSVTYLISFAAPLALLPTIVAVRRLTAGAAPSGGIVAARYGVAGVLGLALSSLDGAVRQFFALGWNESGALRAVQVLTVVALGCTGLWLLLSGDLLRAAGVLPRTLGRNTMLLGLSWVGFALAGLVNVVFPTNAFVPLSWLLLVVPLSHLIWSGWVGLWLVWGGARPGNDLLVEHGVATAGAPRRM